MAGLQVPLSTLRLAPRDALRMTRGQSGYSFTVGDFHSLLFVDLPAHKRTIFSEMPSTIKCGV